VRGKPDITLRAECIRLRRDERLSLREIHGRTGAPKGSLSSWLRPFPLKEEERVERQHRARRYQTPKKERGAESLLHQQVPAENLSNHQRAKVAEAAVLLRILIHGMSPYGSVFDGDKTDWLVEVPNTPRVLKIQVKWTQRSREHGLPLVGLTCSDGHKGKRCYKPGEFDFIVGYDYFTDMTYVWSWEEVASYKAVIAICPEAEEAWHKITGR